MQGWQPDFGVVCKSGQGCCRGKRVWEGDIWWGVILCKINWIFGVLCFGEIQTEDLAHGRIT